MKRRGRLAQEIGDHNSATSCVARLAQEFGNQTATFRVAPLAQEFGNLTATTRVAPLAQEFGNQTATPCVAQLAQEFGNLTATSCVAQLAQEFGNQTASCLTQLAQVIGNQTVLDDRTAERESAHEEFQELSEVQLLFCIMPAQARDRSRSRDRSWHVGDQFAIVGPPWSRWYPGKRGGWQPKFWWGHPDDPTSTPVLPTELFIDTSATFTITDIHIQNSGPRFLAVQIQVDGYHVWTNVAKHGVPWARRSR